jgi:Insect cuticle protein
MSIKLFIFSCLLSIASAGILSHDQPAIIKYLKVVKAEPEEPANYEFNYEVNEASTGDVKKQHETAKNGAISGYYTVNDADGFKRIVHYTADDEHGFQADIKREPLKQSWLNDK